MEKDVKNELLINNLIPALTRYVERATLQELMTSKFSISDLLLNSAIYENDIKLVTCVSLGDSQLFTEWTDEKKTREFIKEMNDVQLKRLRDIAIALDNDIWYIVEAECKRRKL